MSGKLKVLGVDDNKDFCQNVSDILELKDYEVVTAYDGFNALELVKQDGFDVVLMDVKMPVMDGVATFKKMKEVAPHTQVIMVSAYVVEELIREALWEGAFGALGKPLNFDELFALLERAGAGSGAMVLLADDENLCANMKDILEDRGYRVRVAHDGGMAVEQARKNNFDIMLLDMKMPVLNGLETYLAIRDFRPDVVAIMITGYPQGMGKLAQQALQKNAYTYLEKPIDMDKLTALLERIKEQKDKGVLEKPR